MARKHFVARCLIDGKPHPDSGQPYLLHVVTHGVAAHPGHKVIRNEKDALEHFQKLATNHRIEDEDGVRYISHVDAEGNEHTISQIEPVEEYDVNKHGFDPGTRAPKEALDALMKGAKTTDVGPPAPAVPPDVLAATLKQ